MNTELRELSEGDREALAAVDGGNGWNADADLWAGYLAEHRVGRRLSVIAWAEGAPVGYGGLVWRPAYEPFRAVGVPEIDNLGVDVKVRQQGVATRLIGFFEERARERGARAIGLGVGLYADYGPAQRLYFKLGYRPDGRGITSANLPVAPMARVRLDDDLVLWLTKDL
jgi:GNAT superfamily N-acetyltransferase